VCSSRPLSLGRWQLVAQPWRPHGLGRPSEWLLTLFGFDISDRIYREKAKPNGVSVPPRLILLSSKNVEDLWWEEGGERSGGSPELGTCRHQ